MIDQATVRLIHREDAFVAFVGNDLQTGIAGRHRTRFRRNPLPAFALITPALQPPLQLPHLNKALVLTASRFASKPAKSGSSRPWLCSDPDTGRGRATGPSRHSASKSSERRTTGGTTFGKRPPSEFPLAFDSGYSSPAE